MGKPCSVCAHLERANIDVLLARQVCNLSATATHYGLKRDALRRHRERHLPGFLSMLAQRADIPGVEVLAAEYERLYAHALDALALVEAGTIAHVADDGTVTTRVSPSAQARAIREARASLDGLVRLSAARDGGAQDGSLANGVLDARLSQALTRVLERQALNAGAHEVEDAHVVDEVAEAPPLPTPGPGPGSGPAPHEGERVRFSETPSPGPVRNVPLKELPNPHSEPQGPVHPSHEGTHYVGDTCDPPHAPVHAYENGERDSPAAMQPAQTDSPGALPENPSYDDATQLVDSLSPEARARLRKALERA